MITKFDSLYAGHVDMTDVGYGGTAVNDRLFGNDHLATAYDKAENIAKTMDRLGYDTFWMAEHHFQPEGYECIPNILMLAVHLTHVTERLKIGCGFNIAPMWHPLRLAEDYATADILTGGRVIFGVGRGYHTREVDTFGAPLMDQEANRNLFEEQVDVLFKSFNEESFSHKGEYYTIPPEVPYRGYTLKEITLVPRPVNLPVECWQPIQSATPRGLDFMAKHGIKGVIGGGVAEGGGTHRVIEAFRDANARGGARPGAWREPFHRVPLLPGGHAGGGDREGGGLLRGEPEDVRASAAGSGAERRADRRYVRPVSRSDGGFAASGGRGEGGRIPGGAAGSHHRAAEEAGGDLPGAGPRGCQPSGRDAGVGHPGATGAVRRRGDAGVRGQDGSRGGGGQLGIGGAGAAVGRPAPRFVCAAMGRGWRARRSCASRRPG